MRTFTLILLTFFAVSSFAQITPNFNTEYKPSIWHNPSSYGTWNNFNSTVMYKGSRFALSNPSHALFVKMEGKVNFSENTNSNKLLNLGVGGNAIIGHQGNYNTQMVNLNINNSFQIGTSYLSVGIAPGIKRSQYLLSTSALVPSQSIFTLGGGIMWYSDHYFVGASVTNIVGNRVLDETGYENARNYYLNGGYQFTFSKFKLFPTFELRYIHETYINGHILTNFQFAKDWVTIGVGSNFYDMFMGTAALNMNRFTLAYNFEYGTQLLNDNYDFKHEVRVSYSF